MAVVGSREGRGKPQKREDDDDRKRFRLKNQGLYKKYIIFVLFFTIPVMPFCIYLDSTKFKGAGIVLYLCIQSFVCFLTSYLLICKKSYNILAGMTEEEYNRIEKIPKEKQKMEKNSKKIGYIFVFIGILLLFSIYLI